MTEAIHRPGEEYPITHLATKLGENEELDEFVRKLCRKIKNEKKRRNEAFETDWEQCLKNYWATNKRDDAGKGDAQLDFTLTFEICQDASSNLANPIFAQDKVFVAQGRPGFSELAAQHDTLLDWMADRADYMAVVDNSLRNAQIYTKTIVKAGWSYKEKVVKYWDWEVGEQKGPVPGSEPTVKKKTIAYSEGSFPYVVDTRRIFHPIPCADIDEAEWFAEEFETTSSLIEIEKDRGYYRSDLEPRAVGDSKYSAENDEKDADEIFRALDVDKPNDDTETIDPVKLMEVYTTFDKEEVILVLDIERETWTAAIENFFQTYPRPYASFAWYETLGSIDGRSLCSVLDQGQAAYTAIMNILLDTGTRTVEPLIIALKDLGLSEYLDNGHLRPGLAEVERSLIQKIDDGIKVIRLSEGSVEFLLVLAGRIEKHMRDAASIPSAFRGEELAERPTATGTTSILEKAMQPLYKLMERFRKFLVRIVTMQYARYRQFNPRSLKFFTKANPGTEELVNFPPGLWEDQIVIETRVNSQTMSKSIKKQEALAMVDKLGEFWRTFAEMGGAATEGGPLAPLAGNFLDASQILLQSFFQEFEVPEVGRALDIDGSKMAGEAIARAMGELQGIIQEQAGMLEAANSELIDLRKTAETGAEAAAKAESEANRRSQTAA